MILAISVSRGSLGVVELLLFVLAASAKPTPETPITGYRVLPAPDVVDRDAALRLLAILDAPAACSARLEGAVLTITCRHIDDARELRALRKHADLLLSTWQEQVAGIGSVGTRDSLRVLFAGGQAELLSTLGAWSVVLYNYRLSFAASSGETDMGLMEQARKLGAALVIRIFPPGEKQVSLLPLDNG
jgi:hypothetical protein